MLTTTAKGGSAIFDADSEMRRTPGGVVEFGATGVELLGFRRYDAALIAGAEWTGEASAFNFPDGATDHGALRANYGFMTLWDGNASINSCNLWTYATSLAVDPIPGNFSEFDVVGNLQPPETGLTRETGIETAHNYVFNSLRLDDVISALTTETESGQTATEPAGELPGVSGGKDANPDLASSAMLQGSLLIPADATTPGTDSLLGNVTSQGSGDAEILQTSGETTPATTPGVPASVELTDLEANTHTLRPMSPTLPSWLIL